jgi:hypothetical protein
MQATFWLNDPTSQLWPEKSMGTDAKLNAITRLVIILSILGYLITQNMRVLITGSVTVLAIIILHYTQRKTTEQPIGASPAKEGFKNLSRSQLNTQEFTRPSQDNPMMNVLLPQIQDNPNRPAAAPAFNPIIEKEINKSVKKSVVANFDDNTGIKERLFNDLGDQFDLDMSMRQWYSTASTTIPNDQKSFADFCYGDMISCKEGNAIACTQSMPPNWING